MKFLNKYIILKERFLRFYLKYCSSHHAVPTKCTTLIFFIEHSSCLSPIFGLSWWIQFPSPVPYDVNNRAWQEVSNMCKIDFQRFSTSVSCFWVTPNDFKQCKIPCWVNPNVRVSSSCVWHGYSSNNVFNFTFFYTFGLHSLHLTWKLAFLNLWKYFWHLQQPHHMIV